MNQPPLSRFFKIALICLGLAATHLAQAQDYPNRPIRMLVGFPAAGGVDTLARQLAPRLAELLKQPVIVENRAGAGGNIALAAVAKARPDGYTLVLTTPTVTVNPALYSNLDYDALRDFAPVGQIAEDTYLLAVHPSVPVTSVGQLIALAKSRPGQLKYASGGNGSASHLAGALLSTAAGIDLMHIPYKGTPPAVLAAVAGETDFLFGSPSSIKPQADAGKLRVIGTTSAKRSALFPNFPSVAEQGLPDYETNAWYGILAPAGTPPDVIARLNRDLTTVLAQPDLKESLAKGGFEIKQGTPQQFDALMRSELKKWKQVVDKTGMKID